MKTSIIIPFYGQWHLTHSRMLELNNHIADTVEIILVNDCTPNENLDGPVNWWIGASRHNVKYIVNETNLGFGGSHNLGAEIASGDVLVFLSNDVIVRGDFVALIRQKLQENENILLGNTLRDYDTGWNRFAFLGKERIFEYLEGYFLACTRKVWDILGGFDNVYYPYDMEDVDLSTTAKRAGIELVSLNTQFLSHMSGQTICSVDPKRQETTNKNRQKFYSKWIEKLGGDW